MNLTDHYDSFIDTSIAAGRFSNASEAVRAGLHLLERQEAEDQAKIEWLRDMTRETFAALDRGEGIPLSSADYIDALVSGAIEEVKAARHKINVQDVFPVLSAWLSPRPSRCSRLERRPV